MDRWSMKIEQEIDLDKRKTFAISLNYCNNNNILIILQQQINKRGNQII